MLIFCLTGSKSCDLKLMIQFDINDLCDSTPNLTKHGDGSASSPLVGYVFD